MIPGTVQGPPVWVQELAGRFWAEAGGPPAAFPRDLQPAAAFVVPLAVISRPELRASTVADHLHAHRLPVRFAEPDRPLCAALYCWRGAGYVYLDAADPPDEQRFSFAHELAHYLRDYADPRRKLELAIGPAALDVLDGLRPPAADERLHAVLRHRSLTPHCHFMSRDPAGRPGGEEERRAEADADRLAFELLAPAELFHGATDPAVVESRLIAEFGLPPSAAREYAFLLLPRAEPPSGFLARVTKSR